jgi:hypothetical protein
MKPGLETAIRELLKRFDDSGRIYGSGQSVMDELTAKVLRLRSAFNIETGNSETVDIPVTDGISQWCQRENCEACKMPQCTHACHLYSSEGR